MVSYLLNSQPTIMVPRESKNITSFSDKNRKLFSYGMMIMVRGVKLLNI